jgi:hypothetical protein
MARTEEEIRSYIRLSENIQRGEDIPEEEIRRDNPKDSPSGKTTYIQGNGAWDVYKEYTTSAQTMSGKRDGEKEKDPDGIYSTDH